MPHTLRLLGYRNFEGYITICKDRQEKYLSCDGTVIMSPLNGTGKKYMLPFPETGKENYRPQTFSGSSLEKKLQNESWA
jgi:hypothetical protein